MGQSSLNDLSRAMRELRDLTNLMAQKDAADRLEVRVDVVGWSNGFHGAEPVLAKAATEHLRGRCADLLAERRAELIGCVSELLEKAIAEVRELLGDKAVSAATPQLTAMREAVAKAHAIEPLNGLRLEVGKFYINRREELVGPIKDNHGQFKDTHPFWDGQASYTERGRWASDDDITDDDLILEAQVQPESVVDAEFEVGSDSASVRHELPDDAVIAAGDVLHGDTWLSTVSEHCPWVGWHVGKAKQKAESGILRVTRPDAEEFGQFDYRMPEPVTDASPRVGSPDDWVEFFPKSASDIQPCDEFDDGAGNWLDAFSTNWTEGASMKRFRFRRPNYGLNHLPLRRGEEIRQGAEYLDPRYGWQKSDRVGDKYEPVARHYPHRRPVGPIELAEADIEPSKPAPSEPVLEQSCCAECDSRKATEERGRLDAREFLHGRAGSQDYLCGVAAECMDWGWSVLEWTPLSVVTKPARAATRCPSCAGTGSVHGPTLEEVACGDCNGEGMLTKAEPDQRPTFVDSAEDSFGNPPMSDELPAQDANDDLAEPEEPTEETRELGDDEVIQAGDLYDDGNGEPSYLMGGTGSTVAQLKRAWPKTVRVLRPLASASSADAFPEVDRIIREVLDAPNKLGRLVHEAWRNWEANVKVIIGDSSWKQPWDQLSYYDQQAMIRIGEALRSHFSSEHDRDTTLLLDLIEDAWSLICNVSLGDWSKQSPEWQQAAERVRSKYHERVGSKKGSAS